MQHTPSNQAPKKKSNKALTVIPWIGLVLFILTVAAGGYLYATKKLVIATDGNGIAATEVCGDDIVKTYNSAAEFKIRGSDTDLGTDVNALDKLDKEIRAKSGFEKDPTCQTILYWNAISSEKMTEARTALNSVTDLHKSRHFADSDLVNTSSITIMTRSLNAYSAKSQ